MTSSERMTYFFAVTSVFCNGSLSKERNLFSAQNQTLRSYRVYISPTK